MFWFTGMLPDLATLRDRATTRGRRIVYGILSLGWRGSGRHWHRYERVYLLLAALAAPLVLSVHSVVSFDFAVAQLPGWHSTIFPPYFVAGAIFSGFAMVITLLVPVRAFFGLEEIITTRHLENMAKITLATGLMVAYSYGVEFFMAWYSGNPLEQFVLANRAMGPYAWAFWIMMCCNVAAPQAFWFKKVRTTPWTLVGVSVLINVGMWFERFVIIVTGLSHEYEPWQWSYYLPRWPELGILIGSFCWFSMWFLLFIKFFPAVAISEIKEALPPPVRAGGLR
jgi:molybdopterin-containing oxidoreductase family membrane subunit